MKSGNKDNEIIVLLGKCAAGKDYNARKLQEQGYNFVVSTTTRPMRKGESEGNPYYFTTNDVFEEKIRNEEMIEYREYIRDGKPWYYGVEKIAIDNDKKYVAVLDIVGLREFRKKFGERVHAFYLYVPEYVRKQRCIARGDFNEEEWERRKLTSDDLMFTDDVIREIGETIEWKE